MNAGLITHLGPYRYTESIESYYFNNNKKDLNLSNNEIN